MTMVECAKNRFRPKQNEAEHEEGDNFPAGQPSQIVAEEKKRETKRRDHPGHAGPRDLEFEVGANDSKQEQQGRELRDPKSDSLKPAWIQGHEGPFQPGLLREIPDRFDDALREQWFAVDDLGRLLGRQRQERTFRMHDAIADLYFLLLGHEGFADVRIMAIARGRTPNERGPVGKGLVAFCARKIFAGRKDRRRRADSADGRHVDVPRGKRDERARGTGVRVDKGVGRNGGVVEHAGDFRGAVEASAVGVHFKNDPARAGALRGLYGSPEKQEQGG